MNKLLTLGMILLSTTALAADLDKTVPAGTVSLFLLEHTNGDITITGTNDSNITIKTHQVRGDDTCFTTTDMTNTLFDMQTERLDLTIDPCVVNATITLPKTMAIEATVGRGNITIQGMTGNVTAYVDSGALTVKGSFPRALLQVGVGKLDATWETVPKVSAATFYVGRGDAVLNFPKGTPLTTELQPGRASVTTHAYITDGAAFKIIGTMHSGTLLIQ